MRSSSCYVRSPFHVSKRYGGNDGNDRNRRFLHQKSLPPLAKSKTKSKDLEEVKPLETAIQSAKLQRDIFGATILPQNLSFENAKRLSDNQIRLGDIPLVDENEAAEILAADKMRTKRENLPKIEKKAENFETMAEIRDSVTGNGKNVRSIAESFWIADPYDAIPGPKISIGFFNGLKEMTRQVTIASLFRYIRGNTFAPFETYGPVIRMPEILGGKIVVISRPEHISEVFDQDRRSPNGSILDSIERCRLRRRGTRRLGSDSNLARDWEALKKTINDEPLIQNTEKYFDGINEAAEKFVRRIKTIRNGQNEVPEDFLFELNKWSLECLCFLIFERSFGFLDHEIAGSKSSQLLHSLTVATKKLRHLESGFQLWRFVNTGSLTALGSACDVLETIISEYVAQVQLNLVKRKDEFLRGSAASLSAVEILLLREDATPEDVVSSILDTLVIGMNTMSTSLGFLFYHLSMNPRAQFKVWREAKEILPEKYTRLEQEHLSSFRYVQACLKESIRLKMPIPHLTRILSRNVTINNYQIPKGTFVLMTARVECLKGENFDEPLEFYPERWLDKNRTIGHHPFASLPVGHYFDDGLERKLAEISVWICASLVSRHFAIDYAYGEIEATNTVISFPNKPLKFAFTDRKT